jgi:prepilin-type N-terminal cleavage/methylation domain-containing protein
MHLILRRRFTSSSAGVNGAKTPRPSGARRAFTLVELIVSLMLLGVIMGAMLDVLVRQQRFYRSTADLIDARTQVRQSADLLPADLRGISSSDVRNNTDFYIATDKTIEFRAITGSSVICGIASGTKVILPPLDLSKGSNVTTWTTAPVAGDSLLVFDDSAAVGSSDDHWAVYGINSVSTIAPGSGGACGTASGFVAAADVTAGRVSYEINLQSSPVLSPTIGIGAPVRIFHTRRYELYRPSTSSGWYLGSCENASPCTALSPVSGPYAAYSSTAANSGLSFTYYDSLGAAFVPTATTADRAKIWRIRLRARSDTRAAASLSGSASLQTLRDSISMDVTLRNRR